jgi:hypothetical protein
MTQQQWEMVRYSKWLPCLHTNSKGTPVPLDGCLNPITSTLDMMGIEYEIRKRKGTVGKRMVQQSAVFANANQIKRMGIVFRVNDE